MSGKKCVHNLLFKTNRVYWSNLPGENNKGHVSKFVISEQSAFGALRDWLLLAYHYDLGGVIVDLEFINDNIDKLVAVLSTPTTTSTSTNRRRSEEHRLLSDVDADRANEALEIAINDTAVAEVELNDSNVDFIDQQPPATTADIDKLGSVAPLLNLICTSFGVRLPIDAIKYNQ